MVDHSMDIQEIEVIIGADGKVQLSTHGFTGENCLKATEELKELLGNQIVRQEMTAEANTLEKRDIPIRSRVKRG